MLNQIVVIRMKVNFYIHAQSLLCIFKGTLITRHRMVHCSISALKSNVHSHWIFSSVPFISSNLSHSGIIRCEKPQWWHTETRIIASVRSKGTMCTWCLQNLRDLCYSYADSSLTFAVQYRLCYISRWKSKFKIRIEGSDERQFLSFAI